jgi:hypothetical protein
MINQMLAAIFINYFLLHSFWKCCSFWNGAKLRALVLLRSSRDKMVNVSTVKKTLIIGCVFTMHLGGD